MLLDNYVPNRFWQPSRSEFISREEYIAILRMLVQRATLRDRLVALFKREHWLNAARSDVANFVIGTWSFR